MNMKQTASSFWLGIVVLVAVLVIAGITGCSTGKAFIPTSEGTAKLLFVKDWPKTATCFRDERTSRKWNCIVNGKQYNYVHVGWSNGYIFMPKPGSVTHDYVYIRGKKRMAYCASNENSSWCFYRGKRYFMN